MTRQLDDANLDYLVLQLRRIANRADTSNLIIDNHNVLRQAADAIDSLRSQPAGGMDAERYRWMRDRAMTRRLSLEAFVACNQLDHCRDAAQFDSVIDAAMKESAK